MPLTPRNNNNNIFKTMMSNEDGWTLMVGMPSAGVMAVLRALPDFVARFSGSVAAEIRRLHRAIGMSTWEIVMAHNVAAGDPRASTQPEFLAGPDPADEAALFQNLVDGPPRWAPRRIRDGPRLRQSKVTSWALLPEDAEAVIDALVYDEDMAALGTVALDAEIFALHGRSTPTRVVHEVWSSRRPSPVVELPAAGGPPHGRSGVNDPWLLMEGLRLGEAIEKTVLKAPMVHAAWVNPPDSVRSAIGFGGVPNVVPCLLDSLEDAGAELRWGWS